MYGKLLVPLFALALAIGWLFPRESSAPEEMISAPNHYVISDEAQQDSIDAESFDAIELARQPDGHFYAEADIDGTTIRFLVDTGASTIALSASDARALGMEWDDDELRHVGLGVNGAVKGIPVKLSNISIGDLQAEDVDAVIIPKGLQVSLLGQSFLKRVGKVAISGDRMTLH